MAVLYFATGYHTVLAQTITWDGSESSDWQTAANWDSNSIPDETSSVVIPPSSATGFNVPTIASEAVVETGDLTIMSGARVEIGPMSGGSGSTLVVKGNLTNGGLLRANDNSSMVLMGTYTKTDDGVYANSRTVYGDLSYSIFSVPFSDGQIALFNGVFSFGYDNDTGDFIALDYSENTIAGEGYFVALRSFSDRFSLGFGGSPYGSDISIGVKTGAFDNFNLVGNPYTAAISVNDFLNNTTNQTNTTGVIYIWDDGGQNGTDKRAGDYITVNALGTVGTFTLNDGVSGQKGTSVFNGNITTMQGFFVEATNVGDVSFTQDMQVTGQNSDDDFYRNEIEDDRTKIRLALTGHNHADDLLIGFDPRATYDNDYSLDASKLIGNDGLSVYTTFLDERYAIRALPELSGEEVVIKIGYQVATEGNYQLTAESIENLPTGYKALIKDNETGGIYDLVNLTSVEFTSEKHSSDERFSLILRPGTITNIDDDKIAGINLLSANRESINLSYHGEDAVISIYDINGKTLFNEKVSFHQQRAEIPVKLDQNTLYILSVDQHAIKFSIK